MSSALRELRTDLTQRPVLIGVIGAGIILGISGPFDTLRQLQLLPRILYWLGVAGGTFALGTLVIGVVTQLMPRQGALQRMLVSIPLTSLAVTGMLTLVNAAVFAVWPDSLADVTIFLLIVTAITTVVTVSLGLLDQGAPAQTPDIMARLPLDKRGKLIALTATDHYVDVATTAGNALVLIRLADAIKEASTTGLQVHRSHWIATAQVNAARREAGRVILTMSNGAEIPVSRSYIPAVKDAGLLPKQGT